MEDPKPIQWAAELVAALKASGTGEAALAIVRAAMVARFNDPAHARLPENHPDRHLTAREAVQVLERELASHTVTLDKARQLHETGAYRPPPPPAKAADLLPPPPRAEAPPRDLPPAEDGPMQTAGPVAHVPGVHSITADTETIGPKPIAPPPTTKRGTPLKVGR